MKPPSARWIALLLITAIFIFLSWLILRPFILVLLWAVVLAIVARRPYLSLRSWGRGPSVSALLATLFVVVSVMVPIAVIGFALINQVATAIPDLQRGLRAALRPDAGWVQWISQYIDITKYLDPETLGTRLAALGQILAGQTVSILGGVLETTLQFVLVLFTVYYLLRDTETLLGGTRRLMPLEGPQFDRIVQRTHEIIVASLRGVLLIAALQGALGGLAFWALGLSSPIFWGVTMFLFAMIPLAGAFIVWGPAAIYLAATGEVGKAIALALWGGIVIGMLDNVLRPRLVGQRTRMHELVVFFSVLGGLQVFGVLGLVAGPVVIAIALGLIDVLRVASPGLNDEIGHQEPVRVERGPDPLPIAERPRPAE
jgi:predicted PurR-regulated permease PerM